MRPEEKVWRRKRRHLRVRKKIRGTQERPRVTVKKTAKHIYAQLVVDPPFGTSRVLTGVSSLSPEIRDQIREAQGKIAKARIVGLYLAKKAQELGIKRVVFDRSGYLYHGRVKALAEGAREGGLEF